MKKTKHKTSSNESRSFSFWSVLKSSFKFILLYKKTFISWCLANFVLLQIFRLIPNGWTNSLSILWLVGYYIYWCIFIRYIQQHQPYFSLIRIFNGLIPTSKIMFINISIYIIVVVLQYIPLFMGFRDKYLEFFERYMGILQSHNSLPGKTLFYAFMLLISPYAISRPYLAWISSLIGKSRSIIEAYKKTKGNYWNFVLCATVMSSFFMVAYYIDTLYNLSSFIYLFSILSVYFNIVTIGIYKIFYKRNTRAKKPIG